MHKNLNDFWNVLVGDLVLYCDGGLIICYLATYLS